MLFITNGAGDVSPLNTEWLKDGEIEEDDFTVVRSRRKEKKRKLM